MKSYANIAQKIYRGIWLILPETLESIRKQFENHISNNKAGIMEDEEDDMEDEDEDEMMEVNSTAVISIDGIIGKHLSMMESLCGGVDVDTITSQLKEAVNNPDISNILLAIHSPGGTVTGVPELAEFIAKCKEKKSIVAYTDTMAASAAYWLGSAADAFYASPSADVGSVGVYSLMIDASAAYAKEGIRIDPIVSKGSPMKLAGADFKALTEEERVHFQTSVDKIYSQFAGFVKENKGVKDEYLDGRVFDGEDAARYGMIDGVVTSMDDMLDIMKEMAGKKDWEDDKVDKVM